MTVEERIFGRKRFLTDALEKSGFVLTDGSYRRENDFLDGEFRASLSVDREGRLTGVVTDNMTGEEYFQLRVEGLDGSYVNSVRAAYEELLQSVANDCCRDVLFCSDQANRISDAIFARYGVEPDYPWEDEGAYHTYGVFRHKDNSRWFGLIMNVKLGTVMRKAGGAAAGQKGENAGERGENTGQKGEASETKGETARWLMAKANVSDPGALVDVMNLKTRPEAAEELTLRPGIVPAYHMNHRHWISVLLTDILSDGEVMDLVAASFDLTAGKTRKGKREEKGG